LVLGLEMQVWGRKERVVKFQRYPFVLVIYIYIACLHCTLSYRREFESIDVHMSIASYSHPPG
jgi:hypothetical protein